jgi:EmrB/QacA subfamily drug resistance transporter
MRRIEYKYIVAALYAVALFMDLLDTTIVNVALPTFGSVFHAGTTNIEWIITGYLLTLAVFIPVSGWAGDRFGTKRTFLIAMAVFGAGSLACSLAGSIEWLIAARVLQGAGGGMLTPVGAAMVYRAFRPDERARASSIITVPAVAAPASGPIVGGWLLLHYSWRSVFWINLPVAVLALIAGALLLREQRERLPGRFDAAGFVLGAAGLSGLLYALAEAGARGFGDARVLAAGIAGLGGLAVFAFVELRQDRPMLDLRLFAEPMFRSGSAVQFLGFGAQFGALFLLPLFLQAERGLTPLASGLTTFPQAIGIMLMAPIAGRLYPRVGPRRMGFVGLLVAGFAMLAMMAVNLETNEWWIRLIMLTRGFGFALSLTSMQTATFANLRLESMGRGSAIFSVVRQVSTSLTIALLATVLTASMLRYGATLGDPRTFLPAVSAFHQAFLVAGLIAIAGAGLALFVDDRKAEATMRRGKPAEAPVMAVEVEPAA